jgi:hypothetical protein
VRRSSACGLVARQEMQPGPGLGGLGQLQGRQRVIAVGPEINRARGAMDLAHAEHVAKIPDAAFEVGRQQFHAAQMRDVLNAFHLVSPETVRRGFFRLPRG